MYVDNLDREFGTYIRIIIDTTTLNTFNTIAIRVNTMQIEYVPVSYEISRFIWEFIISKCKELFTCIRSGCLGACYLFRSFFLCYMSRIIYYNMVLLLNNVIRYTKGEYNVILITSISSHYWYDNTDYFGISLIQN